MTGHALSLKAVVWVQELGLEWLQRTSPSDTQREKTPGVRTTNCRASGRLPEAVRRRDRGSS